MVEEAEQVKTMLYTESPFNWTRFICFAAVFANHLSLLFAFVINQSHLGHAALSTQIWYILPLLRYVRKSGVIHLREEQNNRISFKKKENI